MTKNFAAAIVCAMFSLTLLASTEGERSTDYRNIETIQLAQAGGQFCKNGYRWDQRSHECKKV